MRAARAPLEHLCPELARPVLRHAKRDRAPPRHQAASAAPWPGSSAFPGPFVTISPQGFDPRGGRHLLHGQRHGVPDRIAVLLEEVTQRGTSLLVRYLLAAYQTFKVESEVLRPGVTPINVRCTNGDADGDGFADPLLGADPEERAVSEAGWAASTVT